MSRREIVSLCEVIWTIAPKTNQRQKCLKRYFDVDSENRLLVPCSTSPFVRDNNVDMDQEIENRQTKVGSWCLWKWWREENRFAKNQFASEQYLDLSPIQIIDYSIEPTEIVNQLKFGISIDFIEGNVQFLFANVSKGIGVLCNSSDFEECENGLRLRQTVYCLPQIHFSPSSILSITSNKRIKTIFLNNLQPHYHSYEPVYPEKAVSRAIVSRLQQKCKPNEIDKLQNALGDVTLESISQEVARLCHRKEEDVHSLIELFLENCRLPQLLCDSDLKILSRIIEGNETLYKKLANKVEVRWNSNNQTQIREIEEQIRQKGDELSKLEERNRELQKTNDKLQDDTRDYETLANEAKVKLSQTQERLKREKDTLSALYSESFTKARQEVGRYLSELSIYSPAFVPNPQTSTLTSSTSNAHTGVQTSKFKPGQESSEENLKEYDGESEATDYLTDSLKAVGLEEISAKLTSNFFSSVYFNRRSMILAGFLGQRIAEATSCALTGRLPDVLVCEGACEQYVLDEAFANPESILLVKNPLDGAWFERLASEISVRRKTVFLTVPFVENLRLIPRSFFDVALPYVTNLSILENSFNDKNVDYKFGKPATDFQTEFNDLKEINVKKETSRTGMGSNAARVIERLLACSNTVSPNKGADASRTLFQFGLFSYTYATNALPAFYELLREQNIDFGREDPFKEFEQFAN